jgi:RNA polymerase sigma-70 factor, ECF subfamily
VVIRSHSDGVADAAPAGGKLYALALFRDDAEFVAGLRAGQADAQAELVRRYYERVAAVLHRVLGDDAELQDLTQEVFVKAMAGAKSFRGTSENLEAWVVRIGVFSARGLIRRRSLWRRFFSSAPAPEDAGPTHAVDHEGIEAVRRTYAVLDKLPSDERIALALALVDEMPLPTIAEVCGVSRSTIKRRLQRARKRFESLAGLDPLLRELIMRGEP